MAAQVKQIQWTQVAVHGNHAHIAVTARQYRDVGDIRTLVVQPQVGQRVAAFPVGVHQVLPSGAAKLIVNETERTGIVTGKITSVIVVDRNAVQTCHDALRLSVGSSKKAVGGA